MESMKTHCIPNVRAVVTQLASSGARRGGLARNAATSLLVLALVGCSTGPTKVEDAKALIPSVEPIGEYLSRAQALEASEGGRGQARQVYRSAARAYPADKRPWLRLAQSYFDARDYGNAVLAAEEVVQRDSSDVTAQSLLAVSGLRISTAALSLLRSPSELNSSTRQEAEGMAQNLRSILGEPVLVPQAVDAEHQQKQRVAIKPRAKVQGVPAPLVSAGPISPAKPAATSSPFGALK